MTLLKRLVFALVVFLALPAAAQKTTQAPEKFTISADELSTILSTRAEQTVSLPANPYLNKGVVVKNMRNGDMQFIRVKLSYFKDAYLNVQVNGIYTTQVFLLSDKNSAFYKGEAKDGVVQMEKCSKDDIVVE